MLMKHGLNLLAKAKQAFHFHKQTKMVAASFQNLPLSAKTFDSEGFQPQK